MEFRYVPLEIASLDGLKTELLCLFLFSDERPPRGALGLVDWRLCGRFSELLARGDLRGGFDDALLMPPPARRMAAERLLLIGAGTRAELAEARFRALVTLLFARVLGLRVRTMAVALPHASLGWLAPAPAMDYLVEQSRSLGERLDEIAVIDSPLAWREMEPRIERARRRVLADG